jgi:hypothetical protein
MLVVRTGEHDLLSIARAIFEPRQWPTVASLVLSKRTVPSTLGRSAMRVLEDTLAKGLVRMLGREAARAGVALPRPPQLRFTGTSFRLVGWLLREPLGAETAAPLLAMEPPSLADQLLALAAHDLVEDCAAACSVLEQPAFENAPLARLYAVDRLATRPSVDASGLSSGDLAVTASLLRTRIAARWARMERAKAHVPAPSARAIVGRAQARLLADVVPAVIAARRLDPIFFLLDGIAAVVRAGETPWGAGLHPGASLSARTEARRLEVAPLRAVGELAEAYARLRLVGFVDDDYDEARTLARALAPYEDVFAKAAAIVHAADDLPLPGRAPTSSAGSPMSRAYRIRISETLERIVHVEDGVATTLEVLPILPRERMTELLARELTAAGLTVDDGIARRTTTSAEGDVTLTVDVATGEVTVRVERGEEIRLSAEHERVVATPGAEAEARLRAEVQGKLERDAERAADEARQKATARLEAELRDARVELDRVVHRVTAAALKEKAAQLGDVEEIVEDEAAGVLTIRVRV